MTGKRKMSIITKKKISEANKQRFENRRLAKLYVNPHDNLRKKNSDLLKIIEEGKKREEKNVNEDEHGDRAGDLACAHRIGDPIGGS